MQTTRHNIYESVYDVVLKCGNIHNWKDFSINLLHVLDPVCPFDQARIYFLNGNGKVSDQHIIGTQRSWVNAYHEYYSGILNGRYSIPSQVNERQLSMEGKLNHRSWNQAEPDEFVRDYVRPQGLTHSLGFMFFDPEGNVRINFMLDRTSKSDYSNSELELLRLAYPQLNNLHKNFFSSSNSMNKLAHVDWSTTNLTPREIDITMLLCQGLSPSNISKKLCIAQPTVNKHISHIYSKMQVSNRHELLVRILK